MRCKSLIGHGRMKPERSCRSSVQMWSIQARDLFRVFLVAGLICVANPASAQQSRCADCHFASPQAPKPLHISDWDLGAHGRNAVGCEKCHGGDATTVETLQAHRGILLSSNPASPLAAGNLPGTCGVCHAGPYVQFQRSRHYQALRAGDRRAPTCTLCHGDAGTFLLSPKGLEAQCKHCHGPGRAVSHPQAGEQARHLLEGIIDVRASLDAAKFLIRRVKDPLRRGEFQDAYEQVQVPVKEAVYGAHAFVFDGVQERLGVAQRRAGTLLERLANPESGRAAQPPP